MSAATNPLVESAQKWRTEYRWSDEAIRMQLGFNHKQSPEQIEEILAEVNAPSSAPAPSNGRSTPQEAAAALGEQVAVTASDPAQAALDDAIIDGMFAPVVVEQTQNPTVQYPTSLEGWALWAVSRGYYIAPAEIQGKFPVTPNGFKDSTNDVDVIQKYWTAGSETIIVDEDTGKNEIVRGNPNYNYLIDLGKSNLVAYDYDIVAPFADDPPTFSVKSGRILKEGEEGGYHNYYRGSCKSHSIFVLPIEPITECEETNRKGESVKVRYDALGRKVGKHGVTVGEVRSRGQYTIGPGSVHKSGRTYTIIKDVPLAESPEQNLEDVYESGPAIGTNAQNEIAEYLESAFKESGVDYLKRRSYQNGFIWLVDCPWDYEHSGGKGISEGGSSSAAFMSASGALGYKCQHAHCEEREWKELREWMETKVGHKLRFNTEVSGLEMNQISQKTTSSVPSTASGLVEWLEPIPLNDELSPVTTLDPNMLPSGIRPWVIDVSERLSVPLDFPAISALCVLAGATGRRVFVFPKANDKDWCESICLPGAVVSDSGTTKTPVWKMNTKPLDIICEAWQHKFEKEMAQYKENLKTWKKIEKENKKAIADDELEKVITPAWGAMCEPPRPTPRRRILVNDATYEIIHDIMKDNPAGLYYERDELSGWVTEMEMEGREGQRGFFLEAMNGDSRREVDRIGRDGGLAVLCITVFGSFQPELLRVFLSEAKNIEDGTVPRFPLLVWPDVLKIPKIDRAVDAEAKRVYYHIMRTLAGMSAESMDLHFTKDAQQLFYKFQAANDEKISTEVNSGKRSHLGKYHGVAAKIAALFQLIDLCASVNQIAVIGVDLMSGAETKGEVKTVFAGRYFIDKEHLEMALRFLAYLESHMHRIYDSKRDAVHQAMSVIAEHLKDGHLHDGFNVRYIQRKRWIKDRDTIEMAIEELEEMHWVQEHRQFDALGRIINSVGRPTRLWDINPAVRWRKGVVSSCGGS